MNQIIDFKKSRKQITNKYLDPQLYEKEIRNLADLEKEIFTERERSLILSPDRSFAYRLISYTSKNIRGFLDQKEYSLAGYLIFEIFVLLSKHIHEYYEEVSLLFETLTSFLIEIARNIPEEPSKVLLDFFYLNKERIFRENNFLTEFSINLELVETIELIGNVEMEMKFLDCFIDRFSHLPNLYKQESTELNHLGFFVYRKLSILYRMQKSCSELLYEANSFMTLPEVLRFFADYFFETAQYERIADLLEYFELLETENSALTIYSIRTFKDVLTEIIQCFIAIENYEHLARAFSLLLYCDISSADISSFLIVIETCSTDVYQQCMTILRETELVGIFFKLTVLETLNKTDEMIRIIENTGDSDALFNEFFNVDILTRKEELVDYYRDYYAGFEEKDLKRIRPRLKQLNRTLQTSDFSKTVIRQIKKKGNK